MQLGNDNLKRRRLRGRPMAMVAVILLVWSSPAWAYIGPGAGFALGGSILFGLAGFLLAILAVLLWPIRAVLRSIRSRRRLNRSRVRRVVMLGLDGLDPGLVKEGIRAGDLPNFKALQARGGFRPLATVWPAMSPVAWSSFATGVDAGRHNIFDFLNRDLRTYLPVLSSTRLNSSVREFKLGPIRLPLGKQKFELLRKSKAFWQVLGENGVKATVLRVPITFPPEKVDGQMLSAMCVPDLRGTQGTFTHFSTMVPGAGETTGGVRILLQRDGKGWTGDLPGPDDPANGGRPFTCRIHAQVNTATRQATFTIADETFTLGENRNSDWVSVKFAGGKAHGICKLRVTSFAEPFAFYVTPLHIDPEHPAMPISHPSHYSIALAKLHGPFATLGLAEDTWALNERVLDEQGFWDQAWEIHAERETQFFHTLERQRSGAISVVFDATDRIQHMFFRYLDPAHPANAGKDTQNHRDAIRELYRRADDLVGRTVAKLKDDDVLFVVSDHGFKTFQRGVNLNTWLRGHGYLFLKSDPQSGPLPKLASDRKAEPAEIDWSRTRAYVSGLGGFYLNLKGREGQGIVTSEEAEPLLRELADKLKALRDEGRGVPCMNEVWLGREVYQGPYVNNGPDLVTGFKVGYRTDWDAAIGRVGASTFQDNTRSWSGDHCVDPRLVPGILFSSVPFSETRPSITDLAPTILDLFGIATPAYMTGKSLLPVEK